MLKSVLGKVFGTRHERERRRIQPIVDEINEHYARLQGVSEEELRAQTAKFRAIIRERTHELEEEVVRLKAAKRTTSDPTEREQVDNELSGADGRGGVEAKLREAIAEVLDEILPEAFATAREGARRLVGTKVLVTGQAARLVDYRAMLASYGPWAALVVALATLVLLFGFTGSVLLPIKAVLTSTLSIGAALGAVVWVFQDGHLAKLFGTERFGGVDLTVPVLVAAIAFGLSVDYEAFLLSRIRESWLSGAAPQRAVAEGLQRTGRIVTSAALLLVIVFVGFLVAGFAPIKGTLPKQSPFTAPGLKRAAAKATPKGMA